ncbi:hypothetical protein ATE84_3395 [Aquimarina sp. MAR_2010_214]|uniref:hypothetical protein n=1 Tax=Aquimarina sp. MAR_2010_214 TaxID=1250026 RepID=UPI000C6FD584|nr:hypothetical protein [Aquimarina sp. MAR_2010_214]PKV51320.1 hypothetical protein ATE84_3395 [Aquimarina sp. MAR_2010_214]
MVDKESEEIQREFELAKRWFDQKGKLIYFTINRNENNYTRVIFSCKDYTEEESHADSKLATIRLYNKVQTNDASKIT